jgi:pSer/pThr/pTyr-binding forkhead associated (FHA) protein
VERTVDVDPVNGAITLGRRSGSVIELPFAAVSASHALITGGAAGWSIEDLSSANGTFLVGPPDKRLPPGEPQLMRPGERVRLADVVLIFEGNALTGGALVESTATLARRLVSDFFGGSGAAEVARVVVERGPDAGRSLPLTVIGQTYKVGRASHCDLVMKDEDVSREHAAFERHWNGVEVRDLGSRNGILVEGERAEGWRRLYDGQLVTLGASRLRLDDPEDRYLRQMQQDAEVGSSPGQPAFQTQFSSSGAPTGSAERRPAMVTLPTSRGPVLVAAVAAVVLAGVAACLVWFLVGA